MNEMLFIIITIVLTLLISFVVSSFLPGFERKFVQARIQQRIGPPLSSPGIFAPLKFFFKKKMEPNSPLPGFYNALPMLTLICLFAIILLLLPQMYIFPAFASEIAIIGILKIEEISHVLMGVLSKSIMSINHPVPDKTKGAKYLNSKVSSIEDISASRSLRLITFGSFPLYLSIFVPVIYVGSVYFKDIVHYQQLHGPILFSFAGILGTISFLVGMMVLLNEYPFAFLKTKADVIEGPYMEYIAKYRSLIYLTKGLLIFTLSVLFSVIYLGIPLNIFNWGVIINIFVALVLTFFIAIISAFSPVFTNKQFYPTVIISSIIGILAMVAAFI